MSVSRPAIFVRDMKKVFRTRAGFMRSHVTEEWALKGVSFEVGEGETYGMLGPNGSGKSTLVRVLSTLLIPDAGETQIFGYKLPGEERKIRQVIGRVSVDAAFYKKLSPRENLLYAAQLYGISRSDAEPRALDILERLEIEKRRFNDSLEEMSRGMQQKIAIARAILINPPLLLLDEPTTGLDPKSRRDVQSFIEDVRRERGTTILLTTHDMAEAERLCERIGFLARGRLVVEGTAADLKNGYDNLEEAFIKITGEKFHDNEADEDG
ncbi:MAG: ABC transporter ATP-binding protein [Armatimonadetes bacterium]|nr:ABC transporter ATP-binding protein [Armatimonadota bacterium]